MRLTKLSTLKLIKNFTMNLVYDAEKTICLIIPTLSISLNILIR